MKKLLRLVLVLILIGLVASVSLDHYKQYQNKKRAQAVPVITVQAAKAEVDKAQAAATAAYESLLGKYNQAVAECQKGVTAYDKLSRTLQLQTTPPVCPAPQK